MEVDDLDAALALHAEIGRRREAGWAPELLDVVPGARTVLLDGLDDPSAAATELASWTVPAVDRTAGALVEIPCVYDGPDLAVVASAWRVDPGDVGELHAAAVHVVAFCGFAPGFAYMTGIGEARSVPRLDSPRPSVPAGSIGIAGPFTGIYPRASPGGWNLVGRTEARLWDAGRARPALLGPGDRVRFVPAGAR